MGTPLWTVEYGSEFKKEWKKLTPHLKKKIIDFLNERICVEKDPKIFAKHLTGNLKHYWRYRLGDYRLVCEFNEARRVITLMRIAHRREVYKHLHLLRPSA